MSTQEKEQERQAAALMFNKLLPSESDITDIFPESFVIFHPKSFVGGDFFMMKKTIEDSAHDEVYRFVILIDCTGHGIEGGMAAAMTQQIIAQEFENDVRSPRTILKRAHKKIMAMYNGTVSADIIIARHSKKHSKIVFSGAMRPVLRASAFELHIIKGCRVRIGDPNYDIETLKEHEMSVELSDTIYVSSDGYESQFGGEVGKKMMKSRLHLWLFAASTMPIERQREFLEIQLMKWSKGHEQVDDICLIGFKPEVETNTELQNGSI